MVRRNNGRVSNGMLPLMLFQAVSQYSRLERKPPVTAALLAANTLIYVRPGVLDHILPTIDDVCFNAHLIVKHYDLKRFFLSAFYHLNEPHLVYNMLSLLWKGIQLETSMGSFKFTSMVAALLGLSQSITLLLAKSLVFFDYQKAYYQEYAVGFSGVLFAMKVVLNSRSDSLTNVHGFMVPARHAAWAELVMIQLLVPGVSFLGHLGGILAGLVYIHLNGGSGCGLLSKIVKGLNSLVLRFWRPRQQRVYGRGRVSGVWRCRACTFDNSGGLSACEMCGTGRGDDGLASFSTSEIPLDEVRQRRVQRFGR